MSGTENTFSDDGAPEVMAYNDRASAWQEGATYPELTSGFADHHDRGAIMGEHEAENEVEVEEISDREEITVEYVERRTLGMIVASSLRSAEAQTNRTAGSSRVLELGVGAGPGQDFCLLDLCKGIPPEVYVGLYPKNNGRVEAARARHPDHAFRPGVRAEDDADGDVLAVVDLSGGTWDLPALTSAHRGLVPGGFLFAVVPNVPGQGAQVLAAAAVEAAKRAGFVLARAAPVIGPGDSALVAAVLETAEEKDRYAIAAQLVDELATRAERTARAGYGAHVPARWRVMFAIKAAPRVQVASQMPRR